MGSVIEGMIIKLTLRKVTRLRMWLGTRAMGMAARIFGCDVDIKIVDDDRPLLACGAVKPGYYATGENGPEAFSAIP